MFNNPFASDAAARWYASGRPDFSTVVGTTIRRLVGIGDSHFGRAVDVGCGTGISTVALSPLAETIIGVDPSSTMLDHAVAAANVTYMVGSAEDLPLDDGVYDLIGVGSAVHWFDRDRFLAEASRIAAPGAWLVVHDHWFSGLMEDQPESGSWFNDVYLPNHQSPPRDRSWQPPADLGKWRHVGWERYEQRVAMNRERFVAYLMSQSNARAAIERGDRTDSEMAEWLREQVEPHFDGHEATLVFGGFVACHQQTGPDGP